MSRAKVHDYGNAQTGRLLVFHCPGCGCDHGFDSKWSWNGSLEAPTFAPSLLCNPDHPEYRCHSFVVDGRIQFLSDCYHALAGQTVEIPLWSDGL